MRSDLAEWVKQLGALNDVRKACAEGVERGECTFNEARAQASDCERELLIKLVRDAAKTPADAEAEAMRLGCGPLLAAPDAARFDPKQETFWTLHMALAWIMWGTPVDVCRHWDSWRLAAREWAADGLGYSPQPLEPTTFFELRHDALITEKIRGNAPRVSAEDARDLLWRALQRGEVESWGVNAAGDRVPLDPLEFFSMQLREDALKGGRYRDVIVRGDTVQEVWPKRSTRITGRVSAEAKCREWLEGEMKVWCKDKSKPILGREHYLHEARKRFKGLSGEGFGRPWKAAIEETGASAWSHPGRRSKTPGPKSPGQ